MIENYERNLLQKAMCYGADKGCFLNRIECFEQVPLFDAIGNMLQCEEINIPDFRCINYYKCNPKNDNNSSGDNINNMFDNHGDLETINYYFFNDNWKIPKIEKFNKFMEKQLNDLKMSIAKQRQKREQTISQTLNDKS